MPSAKGGNNKVTGRARIAKAKHARAISTPEMQMSGGVSGVAGLVLLTVLVFFVLRRHKNKKNKDMVRRAEEDENPVYGLYECDPDPQAEVEDTNDYYADSLYEEGSAVARDNNSMYES